MSCPTVPPEEKNDEPSGYTLSGTLTQSAANGKITYLKLVAQGDFYTATALYRTNSTVFSGGSATYSKSGIAAGFYTAYVFIDMNGNANASDPLPDTGDYFTTTIVIFTTLDITQNIAEFSWGTFIGYSLTGTLTKSGANGKTAYLKLVEQLENYTAAALYKTTAVFSSGSAAYSISEIVPDNYTAWVFIDMNNNANASNPLPDTGDYYVATNISIASNAIQDVAEGVWSTF